MPKEKSKKPTSLSLDDVVFVKDEPPRKPIRVLTPEQAADRAQTTTQNLRNKERDGEFPPARVVCGKTVYIEHEVDECILSLPIRKLKGDDE